MSSGDAAGVVLDATYPFFADPASKAIDNLGREVGDLMTDPIKLEEVWGPIKIDDFAPFAEGVNLTKQNMASVLNFQKTGPTFDPSAASYVVAGA